MRRGEYLRLRAQEIDTAPGVERWDTRTLSELREIEALLITRLGREELLMAAGQPRKTHGELEYRALLALGRRQLAYLRALRYLREHGIAPDWPRGSVAPAVQIDATGTHFLPR
jgi:hypothetical protein